MTEIALILSDENPLVRQGRMYSVEKITPSGFVKLVGIEHPIPKNIVSIVPTETDVANQGVNRFIQKRYRLFEETIIAENVLGTPSLHTMVVVDSKEIQCYTKGGTEISDVRVTDDGLSWKSKSLGV